MSKSGNEPPAGDVSLEVLGPLVERLEQKLGRAKLDALAEAAGIEPARLRELRGRATVEQLGQVLAHAEQLFPDAMSLRRALGPRGDAIVSGWLRRWTRTVDGGYERAVAAAATQAPIGRLSLERERRGHQIVRWEPSAGGSSELLCTLAAGWLEAVPLGWGLPRAQLTERRCVMRGDDRCEFEIRHLVHPTLFGALAGLAVGVALALVARSLGAPNGLEQGLLLLAGAAIGHLVELERTMRANVRATRSAQQALEALAQREAEARRETTAAEQRQHDWGRLLEQELATRTEALERITEQINLLQRKRKAKLQGFSHDVRNPLTAIRTTVTFLQDELEEAPADVSRALEDLETAADRLEELLGHLLRTAASDSGVAQRTTVELVVATLAQSLRGRLRALAHGRAIETEVEVGADAPRLLQIDPLRFDRIIDNLITNAAKYTDRGSITVTLDGAPGLLVVRIADTGRGMSPPELRRLFFGRELTTARHPATGGWGLGLGVVVRLLAELGGELHVESAAGRGSTFEVRLPLSPPATTRSVVRAMAQRAEGAGAGRAEDAATLSLGAPNREEGAEDAHARGAARAGVAVVSAEPFDVLCRRVVHVRSAPSAHADR